MELYEEIILGDSVFSPAGRRCIHSALSTVNIDRVYLYTCEPYVFLVGARDGDYFILDTHPIGTNLGGSGDGPLIVFSGLNEPSLDFLCQWLRNRLAY